MIALAVLGACTLVRVDRVPCEDNAGCRAAFGWGHVCQDDGFCAPVEPEPRCAETIPHDLLDDPAGHADSIVIGALYDEQDFSLELKAIELAVIKANEAGGMDGTPYGLIHCSNTDDWADGLDQDTANVEMARWLADEVGVPAIVGPATSKRTEAAFLEVQPHGTLVMSPSATSPALTDLDGLSHSDQQPGLLWRTAPPDSLQGQAIAADMSSRGVRKVGVLYETGAYGEGLAQEFAASFTGGTTDLRPYDDSIQRETALTDLAQQDIDELLFVSSDKQVIVDTLVYIASLDGLGNRPELGIFLADGAKDTWILDQVRAAGADFLFPRIRGTAPAAPDNIVYDEFKATFAAYWNGLDAEGSGFTAHAFDAAWLVIYGTAWSLYQDGDLTGLGIARGLRRVSSGEQVEIRATSWSTVRANFQEGLSIDVLGASGELDYDPVTEETSAPIDLWVVNDEGDGFEIIDTWTP